jgi:hypothetical protein
MVPHCQTTHRSSDGKKRCGNAHCSEWQILDQEAKFIMRPPAMKDRTHEVKRKSTQDVV